jgi:hypothetical protein
MSVYSQIREWDVVYSVWWFFSLVYYTMLTVVSFYSYKWNFELYHTLRTIFSILWLYWWTSVRENFIFFFFCLVIWFCCVTFQGIGTLFLFFYDQNYIRQLERIHTVLSLSTDMLHCLYKRHICINQCKEEIPEVIFFSEFHTFRTDFKNS